MANRIKDWPVRRRLVIDYGCEDTPQAQCFEDAVAALAAEATVVAVHRVRVVHHEHIRQLLYDGRKAK